MPDILDSLKTYLKTKTAITSLVGSADDARVYFHDAKEGAALPYIVLEIFEGESHEHLSAITGLATNRIQIDCFGVSMSATYALAEAVRLAPLQMYQGTVGSCTVRSITSENGYRRGFDPPTPGSGQKRYWVSRDYMFTYLEATS